jgi:hypothetical protein
MANEHIIRSGIFGKNVDENVSPSHYVSFDPASGEYRFPELHDEEFLESTKPIVKMLRRKDPNMSFGEAVKRAHASLTGQGYSPISQATTAPTLSNNL